MATKRKKTYWVDIYTSGGWCYRSVHGVDWQGVLALKRQSKMLGETIKYEVFNEE